MRFSSSYLFGCALLGIAAAAENTTATCEALSAALPNDLFYPESDTYNASITAFPFLQLRLHPTCVFRPKSAEDVSKAVNILRDSGCTKFAVKGGGHNANVGWANIEDGVTIDMTSLNAVDVVDNNVARVGGGAIWQNVYDVVEQRNLSVLGGRIGVVGVPGFTTGGGVSFHSPERGWSCDSVVNFQIVLATGEIVNANKTSRPDLWAALKGGQSNFGIITRFDIQAFEAGPMWGGRIAYAPEADTALIQGFTDFKLDQYDPYAAGWVTNRYNATSKQYTPTSILWYTKADAAPGKLGHITNVGPKTFNGMTVGGAAAFARNASMVVKGAPMNTIWATTTFHISKTIVHDIHNLWKSLIPKVTETYAYANVASELTFQSLAPPPKKDAPNSLGFSSTSTPQKDLVFLQIIFYFKDAGASEGLNNALKDFVKLFEELAIKEGVHNDWIYTNFAAWFQKPLEAYGRQSYSQLKRVSRKYDPRGFYQKQLVGGFKL